ncbi:WXG100 family type VII secretion target [Amycolatopsis sp. CA-230715]|uniref:WXG100 family type VII secretion target n=1 Tax=Amycolatopsis sp. CA-230715 TaxID=2745196 RepID=UPI001C025F4E|nr:hypothetical protein [Amycolatopsis sp. CA-230715]QWF76938.1 hypothetical protein HUW46_00318 [Amycolatopsis sp. CA-230715]
MGLDIHVDADPGSMRAFADYFQQIAGSTGNARADAMSARTVSQPWQGEAGEGFRATAYQMNLDGTALMNAYQGAAHQVRGHADDVDAVLRRIGDARDVATKAGLPVTDTEIGDPGPPPPEPRPFLPNDTNADQDAKRAELTASMDWTHKASAYAQCTAMVAEARTMEQDSQTRIMDIVNTIAPRPPMTVSNFLIGLASGFLSRQDTWRTTAASFTDIAAGASAVAKDATHGASTQAKNLLLSLVSEARAGVTTAQADTSRLGTWAERLPKWVQTSIQAKLGDITKVRPFLSKAPAVFSKVSGVGLLFSGATVAMDAIDGKNVAKSITTNGSGLLAGTAAGMLVGGPVGAVLGAVVGTGTGIGVGAIWDNAAGHEYVVAPGSGYTGRMQGPSDPGPM